GDNATFGCRTGLGAQAVDQGHGRIRFWSAVFVSGPYQMRKQKTPAANDRGFGPAMLPVVSAWRADREFR
ncbi:hypothetical protein, partial [Mesorhizobium sp. M7A.F.Ca.CA.002.04.1.1]|uniref:hypothetical protein n=1 Tax=Mesorhizobium sp. M7A.F.Ca.CA.002.04.1.1 TaxID=2496681 RepID=UPI0019D48F9E